MRKHVWLVAAVMGCSGAIAPPGADDPAPTATPDPARPGDTPRAPAATDAVPAPPVPAPPTGFGKEAGRCDGVRPAVARSLRLHTPAELRATFAALAAPATATWDVPPEFPTVEGLTNDQSQLTVTPAYLASAGDNGRTLARLLTARAPFDSAACTADVPAPCADGVLAPLGRLLWRRPLDADERAWLVRALKSLPAAATSRERIEAAARLLALSPQAVLRFEGGAADLLDGWQRADAVAYALTGAPPDAELARAADAGALRDPASLREQIRRVAGTPAARTRLTGLIQDVFDIHDPEAVKKDAKAFPDFTTLARAVKTSFETFVGDVLAPTGNTFQTLYTAPSFKDVTGKRAGLFTHPAFLITHSDELVTRPIHRARAVVERATCLHLPDPPPEAANAKPPADPGLSPRQLFEKMTTPPQCAVCHGILNPVGFSLDGYDAVGKLRTTLAGFPIDTSGQIELDGAKVTYDGPPALMEALAASTTARECFVTRAYRHVAGRTDDAGDVCLKARAFTTLKTGGNVREAVVEALATYVEATRRAP